MLLCCNLSYLETLKLNFSGLTLGLAPCFSSGFFASTKSRY
jgi:hypothetical protein